MGAMALGPSTCCTSRKPERLSQADAEATGIANRRGERIPGIGWSPVPPMFGAGRCPVSQVQPQPIKT